MDFVSEEWTRVLKAITGHALCDRCIAESVRLSLSETRVILRRIEGVMVIDTTHRCEHCGTNLNVYGVLPPSPRSSSRRA